MPAMVNSPPGDHPDKGAENAESQAESKADLAAAPVSGQGSTGGDSQAKPRNVGPVPAFLDRTYAMVDEEDSAEIVGWGVSGDTFVIKRLDLFEEEVIPRFFNHRNLYSFVRQLNNHGFSKVRQGQSRPTPAGQPAVPNRGAGGHSRGTAATRGKQDPNVWWEFKHPNFQRGRRELMTDIKRRRERPSSTTGGGANVTDEVINLMKREIDKVKGGLRVVDAKIDELKEIVLMLSRQAFAVGPPPSDFVLSGSGTWQGRSRGGGGVGSGPASASSAVSDMPVANGGDVEQNRREGTGGVPERAEEYYVHHSVRAHQRSSQQQQQEQHWWYPQHLHAHLWQQHQHQHQHQHQRDQYFGFREMAGQARHPSEMTGPPGSGQWSSSVSGPSSHGDAPDEPPWSNQDGQLSGGKRKATAPFPRSSERPSGQRADSSGEADSMYRTGNTTGEGVGGEGGGDRSEASNDRQGGPPPGSPESMRADGYSQGRGQTPYGAPTNRGGRSPYMFYEPSPGHRSGSVGPGGRDADDSANGRSYGRNSGGGPVGINVPPHVQSAAGPLEASREVDVFHGGRGWRLCPREMPPRPVGSPISTSNGLRGERREWVPDDLDGMRGRRSVEDSPLEPGAPGQRVNRSRSPPRSRAKKDIGGRWTRGEPHEANGEARVADEEDEVKPMTR